MRLNHRSQYVSLLGLSLSQGRMRPSRERAELALVHLGYRIGRHLGTGDSAEVFATQSHLGDLAARVCFGTAVNRDSSALLMTLPDHQAHHIVPILGMHFHDGLMVEMMPIYECVRSGRVSQPDCSEPHGHPLVGRNRSCRARPIACTRMEQVDLDRPHSPSHAQYHAWRPGSHQRARHVCAFDCRVRLRQRGPQNRRLARRLGRGPSSIR